MPETPPHPTCQSIHLRIEELTLLMRIGVGDAERAVPQRLLITLEVEVEARLPQHDSVEEVVDYDLVAERVRAFAGQERKLLETLAAEIGRSILELNRVRSLSISIRKPDLFADIKAAGIDVRFCRDPE